MSVQPFPQGELRDQKRDLRFSRVPVPYSCLDGGRSHRPPNEQFPQLGALQTRDVCSHMGSTVDKAVPVLRTEKYRSFLLTTVPISALGDLKWSLLLSYL